MAKSTKLIREYMKYRIYEDKITLSRKGIYFTIPRDILEDLINDLQDIEYIPFGDFEEDTTSSD